MALAYTGFERVSASVLAYRNSVSESDLAQGVDRELISYRALARYYVVTGKEDDAKATLAAEAGLKDAIDRTMKGTTNPASVNQITRLAREFRTFTKIFADVLKVKRDSELLIQNQLSRNANLLRYKLDDLPSSVEDDAELAAVTLASKKAAGQFQTAVSLANTFVVSSDQAVAASALARIKFVETALEAIPQADEKVLQAVKEASVLLEEYRQGLTKLVDNSKEVDELNVEMAESATAIIKASDAMKADLLSDQKRLDSESDASISETERLVVMLAFGGFLLGGTLATLMGKGISRPMTAMCNAMRELANGNFDVVLPGLGRKDEIGEMAGAVEEFKMQAIAKAEREAAEHDAQNKASAEARRTELIGFADEFEAAVGTIVANVSASAVQLEAAAGTLTRTAESTQSLSSQAAGASEQASSNMQSVASATEELSASVDEIGRQVQESNRIAGAAVLQAQQTDGRIGKLSRAAQEIGDVVKLITAIAEQTNLLALNATIEAARGKITGESDRKSDGRNIDAYCRDAGRDAGIGGRHQGNRRHHRANLDHRLDDRERRRGARLGDAGNRAQCSNGGSGNPRGRCQYSGSQSGCGGNRVGVGGRAELGAHAFDRKQAIARGTRPLHGDYTRGIGPCCRPGIGAGTHDHNCL
jgi:methyl-accepting chemotaxis protein